MIVVISDEAKADLQRIGDYIARENPQRAKTFVLELIDKCRGLKGFPQRFALVPGRERHGIRRRPHGAYLIFYSIGADRIEILRVLNAAQDYDRVLFQED